MNIGLGEIAIIIINLVLIVGLPVVVIWAGILLFRRIKSLESRIEKLESEQDSSLSKAP